MPNEYLPADLPGRGAYEVLTATVVPRPIAWVSSRSAAGIDNLAPHSFFTVASAKPPIVQVVSVGRKDTLNNIEATGEFVVNFCTEPMFEVINDSATNYPPHLSEFDELGIERAASSHVAPPRVAAAPVAIECTLHSVLPLGNCFNIFGNVVNFVIDPQVLEDPAVAMPHPMIDRLKPLARLGRDEWMTIGQILDEPRKRFEDLPS